MSIHSSDHYPKAMWNDAPHVFQSEIGGVSPLHIGIVQEPSAYGVGGRGSHCVRMYKFGKAFENNQANGLSRREAYEAACRAVGVLPDKPWLIDEATSEAFLAAAQAYREKSES